MKILFLCTANSCRSILSEALFNHLAPASVRAYSAGSEPKGFVHPLTLEALERAGVACDGLFSKPIEAHAELQPDVVITVCDKAAGEACPVFFGPALRAHWGGWRTRPRSAVRTPRAQRRSTPRSAGSRAVSRPFSPCRSTS